MYITHILTCPSKIWAKNVRIIHRKERCPPHAHSHPARATCAGGPTGPQKHHLPECDLQGNDMGAIICSFNVNISPETPCAVPECEVVRLQNDMQAYGFVMKDFATKRGVICPGPRILVTHRYGAS